MPKVVKVDRSSRWFNFKLVSACGPYYRNFRHVKHLISHGADVNETDDEKMTPLIAACYYNLPLKVIEFLIKSGAKVNYHDKYHNTPLCYALGGKINWKVVDLLLSSGAVICKEQKRCFENIYNYHNPCWTLIFCTITSKYIPLYTFSKMLEKHPLFLNSLNEIHGSKNTPLIYTIRSHKVDKAAALIRYGADVNKRDDRGYTAFNLTFHLSLFNGETEFDEIRNLLIEYGADINIPDKKGRTPLHEEIQCQNIKNIKFLLKNGANPFLCDNKGRDCIKYAFKTKNQKVVQIISNHILDLSEETNNKRQRTG